MRVCPSFDTCESEGNGRNTRSIENGSLMVRLSQMGLVEDRVMGIA